MALDLRSGCRGAPLLARHLKSTALFICSALAIIPVAGWIGRATEELAFRVGEGLGGLLNATFGNAALGLD